MTIFIVMAEFGEYDQRSEFIIGAFTDRTKAQEALDDRVKKVVAYQTAWNTWVAKGGSRSGIPHPECQTPGECVGDRFAIIEIPENTTSGDFSPEYIETRPAR